jgi:hypothetical protein
MSSLLDPQTKGGVGILNTDQEFIWEKIQSAIILISQELDRRAQAHPLPANNNIDDDNNNNQRIQLAAACEPNDLDAIFEELNEYYIGQQQGQNLAAELVDGDDADIREQHRFNLVNAELLLYRQEQSIRLYKAEGAANGSFFNCPFTWWEVNELKFPLIG